MKRWWLSSIVSLCVLAVPTVACAQMDPYFTAINVPVPQDTLMLMALPDFQVARTGPDFVTGMGMIEYGITPRWTAGVMGEGQKIGGLPLTYGGLRINTYARVFPHDRLFHFTLYGEYEDLNQAALYKMEVSGFGGEDLVGPLSLARRTPARTFEQRAIAYHDWGRIDVTANFISETDLDAPHDNSFGYAVGLFRQPRWTGMTVMPGMSPPPAWSPTRLGYGLEMIGALGNTGQFGIDWHREQAYLGPVFSYTLAPHWSLHVAPAFGLSAVSDPFMFRVGVGYSIDHVARRIARSF